MTRLPEERAKALIAGTAAMHPAEVASLAAEVLERRAEVKRLREVLEYYASQYCENPGFDGCGLCEPDDCDGCRARAALRRGG
jgi:hypothetical protein